MIKEIRVKKKSPKCKFEKNGYCHALACYSRQACNARDKKGEPKYLIKLAEEKK